MLKFAIHAVLVMLVSSSLLRANRLQFDTSDHAEFTCDDIRVGRQTFATLAGKDKAAEAAAINAGHIADKITWEFIDTPCWACYAGLVSIDRRF